VAGGRFVAGRGRLSSLVSRSRRSVPVAGWSVVGVVLEDVGGWRLVLLVVVGCGWGDTRFSCDVGTGAGYFTCET
jgi:hypothetical protein